MSWGFNSRMRRIFPDRKTLMLAADHGYFMGPTTKLEDPRATLTPLLPHVDALMTTRGVLRNCIDPTPTPVVLRVSGGPTMAREPRVLEDEFLTTSVEDALRLNASAIALQTFSGTPYESRTIKHLSELVNEGQRYGLPVLGVVALGDEYTNKSNDFRYLAMACRILAEHGAAFVKTYYCEHGFDKVVNGCYVPLVVAGGPQPKGDVDKEMFTFEMAHKAMQEGAAGLDFGRRVWQAEHPIAVARALRAIVHKDYTAREAYDLYVQARNDNEI